MSQLSSSVEIESHIKIYDMPKEMLRNFWNSMEKIPERSFTIFTLIWSIDITLKKIIYGNFQSVPLCIFWWRELILYKHVLECVIIFYLI